MCSILRFSGSCLILSGNQIMHLSAPTFPPRTLGAGEATGRINYNSQGRDGTPRLGNKNRREERERTMEWGSLPQRDSQAGEGTGPETKGSFFYTSILWNVAAMSGPSYSNGGGGGGLPDCYATYLHN